MVSPRMPDETPGLWIYQASTTEHHISPNANVAGLDEVGIRMRTPFQLQVRNHCDEMKLLISVTWRFRVPNQSRIEVLAANSRETIPSPCELLLDLPLLRLHKHHLFHARHQYQSWRTLIWQLIQDQRLLRNKRAACVMHQLSSVPRTFWPMIQPRFLNSAPRSLTIVHHAFPLSISSTVSSPYSIPQAPNLASSLRNSQRSMKMNPRRSRYCKPGATGVP